MKNTQLFIGFLILSIGLTACIQDDVIFDTVEENIRITSGVDTLAVGDTFTFEVRFTNNIGQSEEKSVQWTSSDINILSINELGEATGHQKGDVSVIASVNINNIKLVSDTIKVTVADQTVVGGNDQKAGSIRTTSSYVLEGDFTITLSGGNLLIQFASDYKASRSLPGLYVYLSNNPNSTSDAKEIGAVTVFEGVHSYTVPGVGLEDYTYLLYYCKPFRVKVGDGKIE